MESSDSNENNTNMEIAKNKDVDLREKYTEKEKQSEQIYLEDITDKLDITNDDPNTITLKKPNEVYYEIYKIAKNKAKQHKKAAISHYLEAKNIKNTYLVNDLYNSDDSSDDDDDNINSDDESMKIKSQISTIVDNLS